MKTLFLKNRAIIRLDDYEIALFVFPRPLDPLEIPAALMSRDEDEAEMRHGLADEGDETRVHRLRR